MLLPPIPITSSLSHHCCQIAIVHLPSSNRCCRCHQHCLRRQRWRHHCCCCRRRRLRLTHRHRCRHHRHCFVDVALSLSSKWGGASFLGTYPTYSYVRYLARTLVVCGNSVFGDHDSTPHRRLTNAKFNNKQLMKKGQHKRGGTILQTWTIMAIHWGLPAQRRPTVFWLDMWYSIQYDTQFSMGVSGANTFRSNPRP